MPPRRTGAGTGDRAGLERGHNPITADRTTVGVSALAIASCRVRCFAATAPLSAARVMFAWASAFCTAWACVALRVPLSTNCCTSDHRCRRSGVDRPRLCAVDGAGLHELSDRTGDDRVGCAAAATRRCGDARRWGLLRDRGYVSRQPEGGSQGARGPGALHGEA